MEERGMGDFLTYKLYLTKWNESDVCVYESVLTLLELQAEGQINSVN